MSTMAMTFLLLFAAGCGLAIVRHPIYGLYAYMLAFYMAPENKWWGAELPSLRWVLVAAVVTFVGVLIHRPARHQMPWHAHSTVRALMLLCAWLWIQTPWALSFADHLFLATLFTKYIVLFAIVYSTLANEQLIKNFALVHIVGCAIWGIEAYMDPGGGRLENIGSGDVAGSAFASMHMSTALAFAGFVFLGVSGPTKWIAFAAIPFILNAIILMATRGAFVGILAAAPVAVMFAPKSKRTMTVAYVALGGVLLATLAHEFFWQRMSTISTITADDPQVIEESALSRILIAKANLQMFADHPLGVGHRGNDLLSPDYMPPELLTVKDGSALRSAHNVAMAVLVDHGIVGFALFLLLHWRIARALMHLRGRTEDGLSLEMKSLVAALATAMMLYWVNAQFANMLKAEVVIWIAAMAAALEAVARARARSPQAAPSPRAVKVVLPTPRAQNPARSGR